MKTENQFWFLEFYDENPEEPYEDYLKRELHYDRDKSKWVHREEYTGCIYPAVVGIHSYRAAKRHLRKHNEIPRGTKFRLVSKFVGYDRLLVKR